MPMDAVIDDRESPKPEDDVHQDPVGHHSRFLHVPAQPPAISQQLSIPGYPPNPSVMAPSSTILGGGHKLERGVDVELPPQPSMQFNPIPTLRPSSHSGPSALLGKSKKQLIGRHDDRKIVSASALTFLKEEKREMGNIMNEL